MKKRPPKAKTGDIFRVALPSGAVRYFQFMEVDKTNLGAHLIRVFREQFEADSNPTLEYIANSEVEFYTETLINVGIDKRAWQYYGNFPIYDNTEVWFRSCRGDSVKGVDVSDNWHIWKPNSAAIKIGKLDSQSRLFEYGFVYPYKDVIERLETGKYRLDHIPD